jgi:transposase-like protein
MASVLSEPYFHDEKAAFEALEAIIWPNGPTCPHCGAIDRINRLKGVHSKPSKKHPEGIERFGLWKCYHCKGQFRVTKGTVFEDAHLKLHQWFQAVYLLCSSKKGCSSSQLARTLRCTVKTAWFASHRIREAMRTGGLPPLGGHGKTVEVDETYIGRLEGVPKPKGGSSHKNVVLTLVERGGSARSFHIDSVSIADIKPIIDANIARETAMMTDQGASYPEILADYASHDTVNHAREEYVRREADKLVSTNTVEGFYSIFKRGMKGIYQHCSEKHLHRYLAEFDFRYSNRSGLGCDDHRRVLRALAGIKGKRLMYQDSFAAAE